MQRVFYLIEYSEFRYDSSFHKSPLERETDKLLQHFANLALAWQAGLLSIEDVRSVQYYVVCIMRNPEIQKYLKFVADWTVEADLGRHPYVALNEMYEELAK